MKQRLTKMLAILLATTMMFGGATTALATQTGGDLTGEGEFEGSVNTEVFDFALPTIATSDMFDFILDPEGLIAETGGDRYLSATFATDASLYFPVAPTTDNGNANYDNKSDKLTVTNKGNVQIDVTLTATFTDNTLALTTDKTFADDTEETVYLALVSSDAQEVALDGDSNEAELTATVAGVDSSKFETQWVTNEYKYVFTGTTSDYQTFDFWLTGACNTAGDWSEYTGTPTIDVVWEVAQHSEAQAAKGIVDDSTTYTIESGVAETINLDLGSGNKAVTVTSITFTNAAGKSITWAADSGAFTVSGNVLTIPANTITAQYTQMTNNSKNQLSFTINFSGALEDGGTTDTFVLKK